MGIITTTSSIRFSTNWNGKLACQYFTTLRLYNEKKYAVGSIHDIWFKNEQLGRVQVVDSRKISIEQINDWIGYLDTGYNGEKTRNILRRMYTSKTTPVTLHWVMLKWTERYMVPQLIPNDQN